MLSPRLLNRQPNQAVEDKYGEHILFRFLAFICKPIMTEAEEFAIFPGELFYNCIYSLDTLKGLSKAQLKEKCSMLIDDTIRYFNDKGLDKNNLEVQHAISLVAYSVECCLALTTPPTYTIPLSLIDLRLYTFDPDYHNLLKRRCGKAMKIIGEKPLHDYMDKYMQSRELLSDEIGILIDLSRNAESASTEKPTQDELKAVFTLAYLYKNESKLLVSFLRAEKETATDGDWARYALAIYEHKSIFISRPTGFTKWLPKFCQLFGRSVVYQEPNKLRRTKPAHSINAFLPDE